MKKRNFVKISAFLLSGVCALSCVGCVPAESTLLTAPAAAEELSWAERRGEELKAAVQIMEPFAYQFAPAVYAKYEKNKNFAVSPASVFMALALAAEASNGETREQILSALGVSHDVLRENISLLYRALNMEHKMEATTGKKTVGRLQLSNSIWVDSSVTAKQACLNTLAEKYFCYSYSADFVNKNANANQAVREFVKKQTHDLIDKDFKLSKETVFALINTLYLKDIWDSDREELSFTTEKYRFANADGSKKALKLLKGDYYVGRAQETEKFSYFYVLTQHGYEIKFIVPKDGVEVDEIFTEENVTSVMLDSTYDGVDKVNKIRYYTKCLFPEFKASYDDDIKSVLLERFGVENLFSAQNADFSCLTDSPVYCGKVQHTTALTVNKNGIEGAAVTLMDLAGAAGPDEYQEVYETFVVDRAFGFVVSSREDITLFSGVVKKV